ncbi:MASE1 domain-containing protein [Planomonospora sp. ID67723]|uniref:ATP-binding protein n=1 Tax=Planomonospora sp. ID67723 TaxID=2738134 RepID=UPI0018C3847A|nr:ATP-binding protein [Planomonospora sp. ID67723]MBG0832618.1 MASE1 domain-containing protein [Planomonospora sp. ID67723]
MPDGATLRRTAAFTVLYVAALFAGRVNPVGGTVLGLVWPAAGVGALWLLAQRRKRSLWLDVLTLTVAVLVVNLATGVPLGLSLFFTVSNLTQALLFLYIFARLCPDLWNARGWGDFDRVRHLWGLLTAAVAGAAVGALTGPIALEVSSGQWSALTSAVWMARNIVSIVVITALGLRLGRMLERRPRARPFSARRAAREALGRVPGRRIAEFLSLVLISVAAYAVTFGVSHDLPLTFLLTAVTVWAAVRFSTTFVALHVLVLGTAAILFTLYGHGPFASVDSPYTRVLVAQIFVGMLAVVGLALALGRDERESLMRQLTTAEKETSRQAWMLSAIVDSMHDGLVVIDADGRFVMSNPAAQRLLGTTHLTTTEASGLFHPDGAPIGGEQMPHMLALAGHEVRDMDVLMCPPGPAESRMLSVSATRLPAGDRAAVVVFHDVTAERRHRDELAAFAGVVAHDLLNPLAAIDGWAQVLASAVGPAAGGGAPGGAPGGAGDSVVRIQRASSRMRELIQDLLAHAAARDAPIAPVPIDLGQMAREVAASRGDLPAGAGGRQAPVFHIHRLHTVRADRALLRQLLDNLIGNAVKYTAPGERPEITVTSAAEQPGWVRVEVADRGIGIPWGQHEAIFENFHRAHEGGPYSGSGLGLAICKRIVERHGGTIGAEDNPGGGSRFHFTMPAGDAPDEEGAPGGSREA